MLASCGTKTGKTTDVIEGDLNSMSLPSFISKYGEPNKNVKSFSGQSLTWWKFAKFGGESVAPEKRGKIAHLMIEQFPEGGMMQNPNGGPLFKFHWIEKEE